MSGDRVDVNQQETETFDGFAGYDGDRDTDVTSEHDTWGVDDDFDAADGVFRFER